jgi:hypothetical protein
MTEKMHPFVARELVDRLENRIVDLDAVMAADTTSTPPKGGSPLAHRAPEPPD